MFLEKRGGRREEEEDEVNEGGKEHEREGVKKKHHSCFAFVKIQKREIIKSELTFFSIFSPVDTLVLGH